MASYNRVILMGNLTRDVELRHTNGGTAVTDLGLAVNDKRKTAEGEWVDEVTFIDVTVWGKQAENASQYLSKGSGVHIEGRLKLDTWETPEGDKRHKLKVVNDRLTFVGGKPQASSGNNEYSQPARPSGPPEPPKDDSIPF